MKNNRWVGYGVASLLFVIAAGISAAKGSGWIAVVLPALAAVCASFTCAASLYEQATKELAEESQ